MRLINADKVKAESREHCKTCILNGTKHCDKTCVINLICDRLDLQPTVEITEEEAIDKLYSTGWLQEHDKELTTMPDGEVISIKWLIDAIESRKTFLSYEDAREVIKLIEKAPKGKRVVTTKPAVITDKSGHKKEGYYDESRLIFFPTGYTKEFLDADGIELTIESEQMRGNTNE